MEIDQSGRHPSPLQVPDLMAVPAARCGQGTNSGLLKEDISFDAPIGKNQCRVPQNAYGGFIFWWAQDLPLSSPAPVRDRGRGSSGLLQLRPGEPHSAITPAQLPC